MSFSDGTINGTDQDDIIDENYVDTDGNSYLSIHEESMDLYGWDDPSSPDYDPYYVDYDEDRMQQEGYLWWLDIYGGAGNDTIIEGYYFTTSTGGGHSFYGGTGDDTMIASDSRTQLFGGSGNDTLYSSTSEDALYGIPAILGGDGDDHINFTIIDEIFEYSSSAIISGGSGADVFNINSAHTTFGSYVTITDFEPGIDTLIINGYEITAADFLDGFANLGEDFELVDNDGGVSFQFGEDGEAYARPNPEDTGSVGYAIHLPGVTLAELENGLTPEDIMLPTDSHHFSTTLVGTPHSSENEIKERGGFYLGDGVVLTDSRFLDNYDPADIFVQVGSAIPGAEQTASTASSVTALAGADGSEIALLETENVGAGQTGMIIYANPNDVEGDFVVTGYDRADDAETAHEYDITISQGSYQEVTLKNRTDVNSVLLSDGLPDGVGGGWQGSGVYQELDADGDGTSEFYYVGALVGPYQAGTDQAFAIDPISDSYQSLAASLEDDHSADDFARNALIADSTPTAGFVVMTGTFFHEDLIGGDNQDEFYGMGGDDGLYGGIANDRLFGGDGNDYLVGGAGNDNQTGGAGADTFHFNAGDGRDRIMDFEDGTDLISIDAGVTYSDLTITSRGPSSVVDYGSGMITLNGVSASELTEEDFIFV